MKTLHYDEDKKFFQIFFWKFWKLKLNNAKKIANIFFQNLLRILEIFENCS